MSLKSFVETGKAAPWPNDAKIDDPKKDTPS
jgi:hypothetical protein